MVNGPIDARTRGSRYDFIDGGAGARVAERQHQRRRAAPAYALRDQTCRRLWPYLVLWIVGRDQFAGTLLARRTAETGVLDDPVCQWTGLLVWPPDYPTVESGYAVFGS
jgi:hypothetical protein